MLAIVVRANVEEPVGDDSGGMSPRTRAILAWSLLALGTLILLVGSLTVWVKRQALDTDAWVDVSTQLLDDDEVRAALSVYIVDQLYTNVDVQDRLEQRLPPDYEGLAGPIAGALRQPTERAVDGFLQRPRVQDLWENINRAAHQTLLRVLEDETREGISTAEGVVTLDLRVFVVAVGEELGFGEQLDSRLPADAGQITVIESDELECCADRGEDDQGAELGRHPARDRSLRRRDLVRAGPSRDAANRRRRLPPRRDPAARHPPRRRVVPRGRARGG